METKRKKVCNNKIKFCAHGNEAIFRLSDLEVKKLRRYSEYTKSEKERGFLENATFGNIRNFSVFALFDYEIKGSKCGRFHSIFNYHKFDIMFWMFVE